MSDRLGGCPGLPIRALIAVRFATVSGPILSPIPDWGSVANRARWVTVLALPESGCGVEGFCAAYGVGCEGDTSPRFGCCTATWRLLWVNLLKPEQLREKSFTDAGSLP